MAFATIDMTKGITGSVPTANLPTIPVTKGGTGLTAGTTDQILKFTGTTTLASAAISTGKVLQVVEGVKISESYTTSTSYVDTGLSQAITCSSASNKILCLVFQSCFKNNTNQYSNGGIQLVRSGGTSGTTVLNDMMANNATTTKESHSLSASLLFDAGSTSAITYKTQFAALVNGESFGVGRQATGAAQTRQTIVLMEIAA
jgi:hypothetical protein